MSSAQLGEVISGAEVTNVGPAGLWVLVDGHEYFLSFEVFPWFKNAPLSAVFHLDRPGRSHLSWPELDVDLDLDSIIEPQRFPLVSNAGA